ncbi:unnamed protein product [Larinioides sclopetarius]|uniref:Uncharacterized protein n=1 Tax=Larinioides sclopetarius TaxID=280406 RepID=A0AAV2BVX1_9ARAC
MIGLPDRSWMLFLLRFDRCSKIRFVFSSCCKYDSMASKFVSCTDTQTSNCV